VAGLNGVVKAKAEQRLGKLFAELDESDAKKGKFTLYEGRWAAAYKESKDNHPGWDYTITEDGEITISNSKDRNGIKGFAMRKGGVVVFIFDKGDVTERPRYQAGGFQLERFWAKEYPNKVNNTGTLTSKP
jgi:hypothetical protein